VKALLPRTLTILSFVVTATQHVEYLCCLAANLACTKLPWSASVGAWTTFVTVAGNPVLPDFTSITGTED